MSNGNGNGRKWVVPDALKSLRLAPVDRDDRVKLGSKAALVDDAPPQKLIEDATRCWID
ncbi:MAG: hypothetical protein IPP90_21205 [Gemmatimonadaceae bacterium]|nr:hypothetical protein [Gemmatimonadaceae bacterium]